jgi:hypothetical protein
MENLEKFDAFASGFQITTPAPLIRATKPFPRLIMLMAFVVKADTAKDHEPHGVIR